MVIDGLDACGMEVSGFIDPLGLDAPVAKLGLPFIGNDDDILGSSPDDFLLAMGIGGTRDTRLRHKCFEKFHAEGFRFVQVIHPSATISKQIELQEGAQVMAGAVIQHGCVVGKNSIINTRASIDHGCHIGSHVHVAPGAVLSGDVSVGNGSYIGAGSIVIQGIKIGENCLLGAGSVVLSDIPSGVCAWGAPAKIIKKITSTTKRGIKID